ncbi:glycosyl hydrolase 108 family protein [Aquamicrobium sp.]|uniref:glycosyl hydrolase 108 family protein n=1 Tax=Aquamicrobium sp. TaxID=1872579 RepID=UPI00258D6D1F|nr:glycosyl hydrolase 108 family protein [Aquamicrobium sp.]MCK9549610.1 secretion activator protein [Aquamicrobium sp.]
MRDNFQNCLAVTLAYEGGFSSDKRDPGNWTGGKVGKGTLKGTNKGISAASYPNLDIRNLTLQQISDIYRKNYWGPVNGDGLAAGVDLATFDAGVMSGPARAKTWLYASIGGADHETVKRICAKRLGFVQSLKTWVTFGRGWGTRIAAIEAKGVAWALAAVSSPKQVQAELAKEQVAADSKASKQTAGAGTSGTATTAGGGDVLINPDHADQIAGWVLGGLLAAGAAVTLFLIFRAIVNKRRAAAYAAEVEVLS